MATSALQTHRRVRRVEGPHRLEPRSELHPPTGSIVEDKLLPVRRAPPPVTAIYPPAYRPPPPRQERPSGVNRTALPPVVAQRMQAPSPSSTAAPAVIPDTPEMELPDTLKKHMRPVKYGGKGALVGRVYEIPNWTRWSQSRRLKFMREFAEDKARDPHIAEVAAGIIRAAGCDGRDLRAGWAALLKWVQNNVTYLNEPNERLQSPQYTLQSRIGDCDDLAILLLALGHSLRWPVRWVLSGRVRKTGAKARWIEGESEPATGTDWAHIYCQVGGPPFRPTWWEFAEPTLKVPLGWDVVAASARGGANTHPELAGVGHELAGDLALGEAASSTMIAVPVAAAPPSVGNWNKAMTTLRGIAWLNLVTASIPPIVAAWVTHKYILKARR